MLPEVEYRVRATTRGETVAAVCATAWTAASGYAMLSLMFEAGQEIRADERMIGLRALLGRALGSHCGVVLAAAAAPRDPASS